MKLTLDTAARTLATEDEGGRFTFPLYSRESYEALSRQWVRVGWAMHAYSTFTWLGLPILQLPEDLVRVQEVIASVRPDVIIETGIYQGGSLLYHATLCRALGRGRVIGVDLHIPGAVRQAVEEHALSGSIRLIEGDSTSPDTVDQVARLVGRDEVALVILDSHHAKSHVRAELECYARFVTPCSYLVATDGIMADLADVPGGDPSWATDNPAAAAAEFAAAHPEFELAQPAWRQRPSELSANVTYWPGAYLRRRSV